jgi:predicted HTH transcriptional regulator
VTTNRQAENGRKEKIMTNYNNTRDILNAISNGIIDDEIKIWANGQIKKMDERNAKRTSTPSKTALANAPLKEAIFKYLNENDGKYTEAELGKVIDASHNKAGSLVRQLVKEGKVSVEEIKVPKVGKRKAYFIAK